MRDWNDVREDFVQFYELLKEKYNLFDYYDDVFNPCYVELGLFGRRNEYIDFYDKDVDYDYEPTKERLSSIQIIVDCDNIK